MTDRDSPKSFLERWSRKKIEGEREASDPAAAPRAPDIARLPAEAAPKPEFDLASLPSLDSITAATDIRAFLGSRVPRELARAALRRAWSSDPAIRDFKGLAENDWDFTDPSAMPGFGALPPGTDITKMLAQIFGEDEKRPGPDPAGQAVGPAEAHKSDEIASHTAEAGAAPSLAKREDPAVPNFSAGGQHSDESGVLHRNNNTASHNSSSDAENEERNNHRHHGSALPK